VKFRLVFIAAGFLSFSTSESQALLAQTASLRDPHGAVADVYGVYDTVLDGVKFPQKDTNATIYNKTLNTKCGENSGNPVLINGCGGIAMPPDGLEEVHDLLKSSLSQFSRSTWEDFKVNNQSSTEVQDKFHTTMKHKLIGKDLPEEVSPDYTFFFSQPGFNKDKTEALVFVLMFSYMESVPSSGDYFLIHLDSETKTWKVKDRVQYYVADKTAQ
jgi:hypothetical protein